jgi:hypothetical protein
MRKLSFIMAMFLLALAGIAGASIPKQLLRIEQAGPETLQLILAAGLEIDQVRGLGSASAWRPRGVAEIDLWLTPAERRQLEEEGLRLVEIPDLARQMWEAEQARPRHERQYHDHEALTASLQATAATHPDICRLYSIGTSVQGRELWVLKISDNPDDDEDEPEFRYISTIHGDEVVGVELLLYLIEDLVEGYGVDPRLTHIVDHVELHIMPLMNPDGNALGRRTNANYVDLNRNFPDPYTSPNNTPAGRQVETGLVMNWVAGKNFTLSANFHGGATLVNYPFDNNPQGQSIYTASPDDDLFIEMSEAYTITNLPMWNGDFFHGISNGAEWYAISGGMQDWNYHYEGGKEVTIELYDIKWPSFNVIPGLWSDNQESMLSYLEYCLKGLRGIVRSSIDNQPLGGAEIRVLGRNHVVKSSPLVGNYHRVLPAGTWAIEVSKPGYHSQTLSNLVVGNGEATVVDVSLVPIVAAPDFALEAVEVLDANGNLDPGETSQITMRIRNIGTVTATGLSASLSSASPWIHLPQPTLPLDDLAADDWIGIPLEVQVAAEAVLGSQVEFLLALSCEQVEADLPFSLPIGRIVEGFETGNFAAWPWTFSGSAPWAIGGNASEGAWCAGSGAIAHNQQSRMSLTINTVSAGELRFDCRVSSEASYDYLRVFVDGVEQLAFAGEVAWRTESLPLSAGTHTILWSYEKDGSVSHGADRAWVDEIVMPPLDPVSLPCLNLQPPALEASLPPGGQGTAELLLESCGEVPVVWTATLHLDDPRQGQRSDYAGEKRAKDVAEPVGDAATSRSSGGPDAFGYTWIDSQEPGGPVFDWIEISQIGTLAGSGDDASLGPFDLGFDFPFYGNSYSTVRICTNGFLSFTDGATAYLNPRMPNGAAPNAVVAPFWDDLNPSNNGTIHYWADPGQPRFVVQYSEVAHYSGGGLESFQVVLDGDGGLLFQYETIANASSCTVGIENGAGSDGLEVLYNAAGYLVPGLAIRFLPPLVEQPWAQLETTGGTIPAGDSQLLVVGLDATGLEPGAYTASLQLNSSDPFHPQRMVPLQLWVGAASLDPVTDLSISCAGGQLLLSWSPVAGATSYRIESSEHPYAGSWTVVAEISQSSWAGGPCNLGLRCYRVIALN